MYQIVAGVLTPPMELTVSFDGAAVDLSQALTVELLWELPDGTTRTVELEEADEGDLEVGEVRRVWVAGDTDVLGAHRGQIRVTWPATEEFADLPTVFPTDGDVVVWFVNRLLGA